MKRQLILILYIALLLSCVDDSNQPSDNNNSNDSNQPNGMGGGFTCQAGDHDSDFDGIRNLSIECYDNGNRKKQTWYSFTSKAGTVKSQERTYYESNAYIKALISYRTDGTTKSAETTYYESNENQKTNISYYSNGTKYIEDTYYETGKPKTSIVYQANGTKYFEHTYYETGKLKTSIRYQVGGVSFDTGYPKCYDTDGTTAETCSLSKHGIE